MSVDAPECVLDSFNPHGHFVYVLWGDDDQTPVYVGQSTNVFARVGQHLTNKVKRQAVQRVQLFRCADKTHMDRTEQRFISQYRPILNVKGLPAEPVGSLTAEQWEAHDYAQTAAGRLEALQIANLQNRIRRLEEARNGLCVDQEAIELELGMRLGVENLDDLDEEALENLDVGASQLLWEISELGDHIVDHEIAIDYLRRAEAEGVILNLDAVPDNVTELANMLVAAGLARLLGGMTERSELAPIGGNGHV